jgi:predicted nuclease of predicted toxin-antitoxin system
MKFLVDAQLPPALCGWIEQRKHEATHVAECLAGETPDVAIAEYAVRESLILVTKDDDFGMRHRHVGLRVLWLRIGNASNAKLRHWLDHRWDAIVAALETGETFVEVI